MKNVKKGKTKKSGLPLAIIALVLIAAIAGGYWFYSSSKLSGNANTKRAANSNSAANLAQSAPPGAQPPTMLGSPNAAVTVEEFGDFQCPACAQVHPATKEIQSIYGPRIRFIFRNFPLSAIHDKAYDASVAAEAAGLQGKFWQMQNEMFTNQTEWSSSPNYQQIWTGYAQKLGLDVDKFQNDIAGIPAKQRVDEDLKRGRALGVNSTPSIYINGRPLQPSELNVPSMRQMIDTELQQAANKARAGAANQAPANPAPANAQ